MTVKRLIVTGTPLLALLSGLLTWLLCRSVPNLPGHLSSLFTFSAIVLVLYLGAASLAVLGLKNFSAQFKFAYLLLASGLIMFGLAQAQVPLLILVGLEHSPWMQSGAVIIPMIVSICCIYAGARLFARLFQVRSYWRSPWLVALVAALGAAAGAALPTGMVVTTTLAARATTALTVICLIIFLACAILAYRSYQQSTIYYLRVIQWYFYAQLSLVIMTIHATLITVILGNAHPYVTYGYGILGQAFAGLVLLRTAYELANIEFQPSRLSTTPSQNVILDIVMCAAAKVSSLSAIQTTMDPVRSITARTSTGQALRPEDEATLRKVYQAIEQYLATTEPVRRYTPAELRLRIQQELQLSSSAGRFFSSTP